MSAVPVTERRYPPTAPSGRRTPSPPSPTLNPWRLLTQCDQGSGTAVAPFDSGGFSNTGTGFDTTTGTFTVVQKGDTTRRDGYREALVRWTVPVLTIYPDFDPLTDRLDVAIEILSMPFLLGTEKYGIHVAIIDEPTASIAGADGRGFAIYPNAANANQTMAMAATGASANVGLTGTQDLVTLRFGAIPTRDRLDYYGWARNTADLWEEVATGSAVQIDPTLANWRLSIGDIHNAIVSGTPTVSWRVYTMLVRTVGLTGLPA